MVQLRKLFFNLVLGIPYREKREVVPLNSKSTRREVDRTIHGTTRVYKRGNYGAK